ncbi:MAG TPA: hypothetical protein VJ805_01385, partial [Nitrospiraceae bacterium]|nr:hypothetical protein [Nitrospiraceae bacterium]
ATLGTLTHIIHERFYCNRRYAATTSLGAGFRTQARGLASLDLDVLFQVRLGPSGLRTQDTAVSPARRRPQAWRSLFFAPWTSLGVSAVSSRTVMNNVG